MIEWGERVTIYWGCVSSEAKNICEERYRNVFMSGE